MSDLSQFDWHADATALQAAVAAFWPDLLGTGYGDAADLLPVAVNFDLSNPAIQGVLADLAADLVGVSDTTRSDVQALVGQAAAEGWTVQDLAKRIRGLTEIADGQTSSHVAQRAALIATTEGARAYTLGARQAYADSGGRRAGGMVDNGRRLCHLRPVERAAGAAGRDVCGRLARAAGASGVPLCVAPGRE